MKRPNMGESVVWKCDGGMFQLVEKGQEDVSMSLLCNASQSPSNNCGLLEMQIAVYSSVRRYCKHVPFIS